MTASLSAQERCADKLSASELDAKIDGLIAQMTSEELIAQLQGRAPEIARLHIPAYNWWNEGLHGIARNGYATVFPQAIGLAATFDPELLREVGDVVSTEARAKFNPHQNGTSARYAGLTIWSPNINIFRDPRWGRGQETYGEDPLLTGTLGSAFVRGIQGDGGFYRKADATPKHFAVHSGPESVRDGFNSVASQHDLSDTYLAAFRAVTSEAHAAAMMCSYNAINGVPACANDALLRERVRGAWGFTGYVVSDCDAVDEVTDYLHYTADQAHGVASSLKAGVDMNCGSSYGHLKESLAQGLVATSDIDRALHRLLISRLRLGMLQDASCSPYAKIGADEIDSPEHRAMALRAAEESMVLLRNDVSESGARLLPLDAHGKRIAVIGPAAEMLSVMEANYHGTTREPLTLLAGLRKYLPKDAEVMYAQGATLAQGVTVPIPATAFSNGTLRGEYFRNGELSGEPSWVRQDGRIDFDFDHVSPLDDSVQSRGDAAYSIRWTGSLKPPAAGRYRLRVAIDRCFDCKGHDRYRLSLDGKVVLDDDGTREKVPDEVVLEWKGTEPHPVMLEFRHTGEDQGIRLEWEAPAAAQVAEAVSVAQRADVIVALVGLSPDLEGEALQIKIPGFTGGDRDVLGLPEAQRALLLELGKLHKPMVVGITSGSPVATGDVLGQMRTPMALMQLWYPGEEGGRALANLITGAAAPSGRLPVTIYRSTGDLPAFTDYSMAHRTYRYFTGAVEYGFGFGLGYTRFQYAKPQVSTQSLEAGQSLRVKTVITNTGGRDGGEVAELYLIPPHVAGAPRLALQGVRRVFLKAGESREVEFELTPRQLTLVDIEGNRAVNAGSYRVALGGMQPNDLENAGTGFEITGRLGLAP